MTVGEEKEEVGRGRCDREGAGGALYTRMMTVKERRMRNAFKRA